MKISKITSCYKFVNNVNFTGKKEVLDKLPELHNTYCKGAECDCPDNVAQICNAAFKIKDGVTISLGNINSLVEKTIPQCQMRANSLLYQLNVLSFNRTEEVECEERGLKAACNPYFRNGIYLTGYYCAQDHPESRARIGGLDDHNMEDHVYTGFDEGINVDGKIIKYTFDSCVDKNTKEGVRRAFLTMNNNEPLNFASDVKSTLQTLPFEESTKNMLTTSDCILKFENGKPANYIRGYEKNNNSYSANTELLLDDGVVKKCLKAHCYDYSANKSKINEQVEFDDSGKIESYKYRHLHRPKDKYGFPPRRYEGIASEAECYFIDEKPALYIEKYSKSDLSGHECCGFAALSNKEGRWFDVTSLVNSLLKK